MLAGELPFTGRTAQALIAKRLSTLPPSVRVVRPSVPRCNRPGAAQGARPGAGRPIPHGGGLRSRTHPWRTRRAGPAGIGPDLSIAVLPFVDLSGGSDNEYFSDGVSEEILNALAKLPRLRVAARTSSFAFKGKSVDLNEVGAKLRVALVLEGSVRRSGSRLRVSAQLITVDDGFHLLVWPIRPRRHRHIRSPGRHCWRDRARVGGEAVWRRGAAIGRGHTRPPRVRAVSQGTVSLEPARRIGLVKSVPFFQRALERDPAFALAHAGLADACNLIAFYGLAPPREISDRARVAANRALALDDRLAEAHGAVGCNTLFLDWDWEAADRAFDRAIALNPSYAPAYYYRPTVAGCRQQWDDAVARAREAVEHDPLGLQALSVLGWQFDGGTAVGRSRGGVGAGGGAERGFSARQRTIGSRGNSSWQLGARARGAGARGCGVRPKPRWRSDHSRRH